MIKNASIVEIGECKKEEVIPSRCCYYSVYDMKCIYDPSNEAFKSDFSSPHQYDAAMYDMYPFTSLPPSLKKPILSRGREPHERLQ